MALTNSDAPEICFNLWAYADERTGLILRISGKAYVLAGADDEKLAVLRTLAPTDHLSAAIEGLPAGLKVVGPNGQSISGTFASQLDDVGRVFGDLMDRLARLPVQIRSVDEQYETFTMPAPAEPLYLLTIVVEGQDGSLVAQTTRRGEAARG